AEHRREPGRVAWPPARRTGRGAGRPGKAPTAHVEGCPYPQYRNKHFLSWLSHEKIEVTHKKYARVQPLRIRTSPAPLSKNRAEAPTAAGFRVARTLFGAAECGPTNNYADEEEHVANLPSIDTTVAHSARVWNYWLGGKDHYPVDREMGDYVLQAYPEMV